jgi:hypothetical protein
VAPQGRRLRDVVDTPVDLGDLPASRELCFELAMTFLDLPENNLAQTDSATFDIRVGIEQITTTPPGNGNGGEDIGGVIIERPTTPGVGTVSPGVGSRPTTVTAGASTPRAVTTGGPLARTGIHSIMVLYLAIALLLIGAAAAFEGSKRLRARQEATQVLPVSR